MRHVLLTGFPGFLAGVLLERLVNKMERATILVEEKFLELAQSRLQELVRVQGSSAEALEVIPGDITRPDLGLDEAVAQRLIEEVDTVFHLAALYDLAVEKDIAHRVNVDGTRFVGDFLVRIQNPVRYHYVSTVVVAGRRTGRVAEEELEHSCGFHNYYESTKYEAEVLVRSLSREASLRTSIYRPGSVVGCSRSGWTTKYDGPYIALKTLLKMPWPLHRWNHGACDVPFLGVPVDFIADAISALASRPQEELCTTYHLTDPDPPKLNETWDLFSQELLGHRSCGQVPEWILRLSLRVGFHQLIGLPPSMVPYLHHRCEFDCSNTLRDLGGTGVACPSFEEYVEVMVRYFRDHREPGVRPKTVAIS